jgi:uncharacterized membrane protein HdeD (DUF308 family)
MDSKRTSGASLMTDGVISFFAGLVLLFLTGISQNAIVLIFAAYAVILGITQMLASNGEREEGKGTGYLTLLGLYSLLAGVGLLFFLNASLTTVIMLVGAYVAITGVAEVIAAYAYRTEMGGYSWLIGSGVIKAIAGIFLLFNTGVALSTFIFYVAIYAIIEGIVTGVFGYEVREQIGKYHRQML